MSTHLRLLVALAVLALLGVAGAATGHAAQASETLQVTSAVTYDIKTSDDAPVRVAWNVTVANNDPATQQSGSGTVTFYNNITLPVLREATGVTAKAADGADLDVTIDDSAHGPALPARVDFDERLFYQGTYHFTLTYQLADVRADSLLVTSSYAFVPVVAFGDATVTVNTPTGLTTGGAWSVTLEPNDCTQNANVFTCSGGGTHLAALAEVIRPDAEASLPPFNVQMKDSTLAVSIRYFQGDGDTARHLQDLASAALPVIEEMYGVPSGGPPTVNVAQGGRQVVLGYEGLTQCQADNGCDITISPLSDDVTFIHELSHLWSHLYSKRWLSEGLAQLVAQETAARLPQGLVTSTTPERPLSGVPLQLDDWGDVTSVIGTSAEQLARESAGYDRSLRFLEQLRAEVGLDRLQNVNRALAAGATPADSRRFMDQLEDVSGKNLDSLFALWVFPDSVRPLLDQRRQARDRLKVLSASIQDTGLSTDPLQPIRDDMANWRFADALVALDEAEAGLEMYDGLVMQLATLRDSADAASLTVGDNIDDALKRWDFTGAGDLLGRAEDALAAYNTARTKLDGSRTLWERFGLLGSDPDGELRSAAAAFARGEYSAALERANGAADSVANASDVALRRMLIFAGILVIIAAMIGVALWLSRERQRQLAQH